MSDPNVHHPWPRVLLHRWLVQYNPLYLISAAVTLAGVIALSRGVAERGGIVSQLSITAIAELYAWALIGSAALLMRRGRRRAATMLGLLAGFYACDPTLHTATSPLLGDGGAIASGVWLLGFGLKVRALSWAVRLRLSRSALVTLGLGAGLIALGPWLLTSLPPPVGSNLVLTWTFAVFALAAWTRREVSSRVPLDPWAGLVARRSVCGAWWGMAVMLLAHVSFWSVEMAALQPWTLAPVLVLLGVRLVAREATAWAIVVGTLVGVASEQPGQLWLVATMGAVVLVLRALRQVQWREPPQDLPIRDPYRGLMLPSDDPPATRHFVWAALASRRRLLVGAGTCVYVAAWTLAWSGGPWPAHLLALDAALLAAGLLAWRHRVSFAVLPGLLAWSHAAVVERWIYAPTTTTGWGITGVVAGFALLAVGVLASLRLRPPAEH